MRIGRRTVMAAGIVFLAAATGHLMQNADTIVSRLRGDGAITQASLTSATAERPAARSAPGAAALAGAVRAALPDFPDLPGLQPPELGSRIRLAARVDEVMADYAPPMAAVLNEYDTYGQVCAKPRLALTHLRPAMIGLALDAPCHAGETVTISHAGLSFSAVTDAAGRFAATVPALAAGGAVAVRFDTGADLAGGVLIPDLGSVSRFALVTRGQRGLHLNAFVKGAGFGEAGHLRPGNPGLPTLGLGGYMTVLGRPDLPAPRLAEVFTQSSRRASARVVLVADVEPGNCGRDLLGTVFAAQSTVVPVSGAVTFAMPGCEAVGDQLALDIGAATFAPVAARN